MYIHMYIYIYIYIYNSGSVGSRVAAASGCGTRRQPESSGEDLFCAMCLLCFLCSIICLFWEDLPHSTPL